MIAPDNYQENLRAFESTCAAYARDDNPLFVPESVLKGPHKLRAIAEYNAIGYFGEIALCSEKTVRQLIPIPDTK